MAVWRLGEKAPSETKLRGFGGRSFSFDNGPDRVKKRWLEEEKQSLLSKGEAVSGAGRFGVFDKALCSNCGVFRKRILGCETHQGGMSQRAAGDAHSPGEAQTGPCQVSASPGLGSMKETVLDSSQNSVFFLKTDLNRSCRRLREGEVEPVVQFLLSLFDTGNGSLNSS